VVVAEQAVPMPVAAVEVEASGVRLRLAIGTDVEYVSAPVRSAEGSARAGPQNLEQALQSHGVERRRHANDDTCQRAHRVHHEIELGYDQRR